MRKLYSALAMVLVLGLAVTAVALAAKPKDGTYGGKDVSLEVKNGKITGLTGGFGYKCNALPIDSSKTIKIKKLKFHFSGKVKNVLGKAYGKVTISGKFKVKTGKVSGTYTYKRGTCKTGKKKFSATLGKSAA